MTTKKWIILDWGKKWIGVAAKIQTESSTLIIPREPIVNNSIVFNVLEELSKEEHVESWVVGLPLLPSGDHSVTTRRAKRFAQALAQSTQLKVYLVDERLSTSIARDTLSGMPKTADPNLVHSLSAKIIAERFDPSQEWECVCPRVEKTT